MTPEEKSEIQSRYYYLYNNNEELNDPIDPLNYIDSSGDRLIHIASGLGDLRTVELLISAGQDINQMGDMGYTPLHWAYRSKNQDLIEFLLSHGADLTIKNGFGKLPNECE
ncbi:ankyrin repeat domain-containing protein [Rhodanobacter sp. Si-c]|uniref:Ankyrin repeat domain-containing protein n=1 Tax=Rhodanobacter lycopersici TaxID=3162487 RepID=A0ABV3QDA8_9GAMM